jgi:hypothetical protein
MNKAVEILKVIRESLEKHPELGELTPTLYDPDKLFNKPYIGIMERTDENLKLRFNVSVEDLGDFHYNVVDNE